MKRPTWVKQLSTADVRDTERDMGLAAGELTVGRVDGETAIFRRPTPEDGELEQDEMEEGDR